MFRDDSYISAENDNRSAQVIQIDAGKGMAIVAIALSLFAAGGTIIGAIMLPSLIESRAQAVAANAVVRANVAEREARLALDKVDELRIQIAKR